MASVIEVLESRVLLSAPHGTVTFVMSINDDGFSDYTPNSFAIYAIDGTVNGTTVTPNSIQANNGGVDGGISNFNVIVGGATAGSLNDDIFNGTTYTAHSGSGTGQLASDTYYLLTDSATGKKGPARVEAGFTYGILNNDNSSTEVAAGQDVVGSPPSLHNATKGISSTLIIFGLGQSAGDMQNFATATTGNNPGVPSGTTFSGGAPASYPYAGPGTFTYGGNTYLSSLLVADGHYVTGTPPTIDTADSSAGLLAAYDEAFDTAAGGWDGAGSPTAIAVITQTLMVGKFTCTAVTSSNASATYGQAVTFTATVATPSGSGETGTVQFQIDGADAGSPVALSGNTATYTPLKLTAGSHSVVALYSGDANFGSSTSPTLTQIVAAAPLTVTVISTSRMYGAGDPRFTDSITGFVDGDTSSVVSGSAYLASTALTFSPVGVYPLTAAAGSLAAANYSFTFVNGTLTVTQVTTTTAVTSNYSSPVYGQSVTLTARVTPAIGSGESGTVQFQIDGRPVGSPIALYGNTAGYTTSSLYVGSHSVAAIYNGDSNFAGSASSTALQIVVLCPTTTAVTSNNVTTIYGQSVNFTATVSSAYGSGETGTVQFQVDGNNMGSPARLGGNTAVYTTSTLSAGTHSIVAVYSGDGTFASSISAVFTQYVVSIGTTTAVTSNNGSTTYGQPATFTATVAPASGSGETGTVQFVIDGSDVGTPVAISGGIAAYATTTLTAGSHAIVATYSGDVNFAGSTSPTITQSVTRISTTIAVTSNNNSVIYGRSVTFTATVNPDVGAGPTGTVQFQIDGSNVGSPVALGGNVAAYATSTLGAGNHAVVAIYSGDSNFAGSTSPTFAQSGGHAATTTAVTSNNGSATYGQSIAFTATVTPASGSGETGTIQFQIDGSDVGGPVSLSGNTATYTTSTLNPGSHSIVAVYSGDGNFTASTSPTTTQIVGTGPLPVAAQSVYCKVDPDGQHIDIWNNATGTGAPVQSLLMSDCPSVSYTGPAGGDLFVLNFSNGDPIPAGGIALTGGVGQNTLEIIGDPASNSDAMAINGGSFTVPANTPGAGAMNYTLGTISIAAGASLALAQSDSQADQTVFAVNNLSVAGTLDITNNTLLAKESNVPLSQIATWVQRQTVMSSLVIGPNAIASRAVGYGDSIHIPLTVPAGDVEVKYVPAGDTNLDGVVDITDVTRAINDLGQAVGYSGGDILNQGIVNINDINGIINDLGQNLLAAGDGAGTADAAVQSSAGTAGSAALAHAAVSPSAGGALVGSLFSDTRIAGDWLESAGSVLGGIEQ